MNFYCISVWTGMEESYREHVQAALDAPDAPLRGTVHFLRKQMRLKKGKEYYEPFFPGYVFLETEETDAAKLRAVTAGKGFIRFLPSNEMVRPLAGGDRDIVSAILQFGTTVGIVPVAFDVGDRIVILDGPFKERTGSVIAVNRRNKRLNIQFDFLSSARIIGLTYEEVRDAHE